MQDVGKDLLVRRQLTLAFVPVRMKAPAPPAQASVPNAGQLPTGVVDLTGCDRQRIKRLTELLR